MPTRFCRHIRTNGRRCCSPALRDKAFCYFHANSILRHRALLPPADNMPTIIHPLNTTENRQRNPLLAEYFANDRPNDPLELDFPPLEDRESVQVALSMLISALGRNRLDPKRATTMLYGLQVASANAAGLGSLGSSKTVSATVITPAGDELSLDEDPPEIAEFEKWLASTEDSEESDDEE